MELSWLSIPLATHVIASVQCPYFSGFPAPCCPLVSGLLGGAEHAVDRKRSQPRQLSGSFEHLFGISLFDSACSPWSCTGLTCLSLCVYCDTIFMIPCMIVFGVNRVRCLVSHPDIGGTVLVAVSVALKAVSVTCDHTSQSRTEDLGLTIACRDNRMWVVTGPFDGEVSNEVGFQSSAFSSLTDYQLIQDTFQSQNFSRAESHMSSVVNQPVISL